MLTRRLFTLGFILAFLLLVCSLGSDTFARSRKAAPPPDDVSSGIFDTDEHRIQVVPIAHGLERPWSLAFLPNGDLLVTERPGRLRLIHDGQLDDRAIDGVPAVHVVDQGGLLEVALHPRFDTNPLLYFTYTEQGDQGVTIALARGRLVGHALLDVHTLFVADAWNHSTEMFGGRLAFDGDGHVFMTIGDRDQRDRAQLLTDHVGTIVRLHDNGGVPVDNPFVGHRDARPEIYSYGHRNPQGLTVDPTTGALWEHEHGPQGGDELNLIMPGANYGWPTVTYGREYAGATIAERPWREGTEQPIIFWAPSIAPSGMTFYTGDRFPAWKTSLFIGALAGRQLQRIVFSDQGPVQREPMLAPLGYRVRDIRQGPDQLLYVLTDGDDGTVLRIQPADLPPS